MRKNDTTAYIFVLKLFQDLSSVRFENRPPHNTASLSTAAASNNSRFLKLFATDVA